MISSNDHRIGLDQSDSNQSDRVGQEFCMLQRKFPYEAVKGQVDKNLRWPRRKTSVEGARAHRTAWASHMVCVDSAFKPFEAKKKVTG
jgi:hypothetical protein